MTKTKVLSFAILQTYAYLLFCPHAMAQLSGRAGSATAPVLAPMPRFEPSASDPQAGTNVLAPAFESVSDQVVGVLAFLNPAVTYSLRYGDGISTQPGKRVKSTVHDLSPSIRFNFAERISFSYSPSFTWYSSSELEDKVSHRVTAMIGGSMEDFDINFAQSYSRTSVPLAETGRVTDQEFWSTSLGVSRQLFEKSSVDLNIGRNTRSSIGYTDVTSWTSMIWFRHNLIETVEMSIGAGGSYSEIDPGADTYSQQLKGGVSWQPGPRLRIGATAGIDRTHFRGPGRDGVTNPVYGVNAQYRVFEQTSLSVGVSRSINASYFANQFTENDSYSLGLSQRLIGKLNLGLGASLGKTTYVGRLATDSNSSRSDRRRTFSASLATKFGERVSVSTFWQYSESESNLRSFVYDGTTLGLSVAWRF